MTQQRRGLTMTEAATRLGVSPRTMQRYVRAWKEGDRSRGFDVTTVATQRGKGFEYRITFDADTAPDASPQLPSEALVVADARPIIDATLAPSAPATDRDLALLHLRDIRLPQPRPQREVRLRQPQPPPTRFHEHTDHPPTSSSKTRSDPPP